VVSHQAFGYLARDYGLNQVAIMGLTPDAEPKAQDLLRISKFVKDHGVKYIFFEELVSDELAKTLAGEANAQTLVLNPIEGLTPDEEKSGDDYFSLMHRNLQNLLKALQ
jgi:zinc transport system substrate-binding protein